MYKRKRVFKRRRTGRGKKIAKRRRIASSRRLTKKIKRVVFKTAETKTYGTCETYDNPGTCYWETLNNVTMYPAGSTVSTEQFQTRFGQKYHLVGFRIKMLFSNYPTAAPGSAIKPIMVRIVLIEAKSEQATIKPTSTTPMFIDGKSERVDWLDIGNTYASMAYKIDHKKYKTIRDQTFVVGLGRNSANGWGAQPIDWWVPIKKDVNCDETLAGDLQQDRSYYFGFWAYDPQIPATELEPPITRMSWAWKTYWKDP